MSAIGRISGPLLKSNLIRNGIDLAFETDLLYLDVNNQRIGIKTVAPQHELDVNGTTRTVNLVVTNQGEIGDITILGNTISSSGPYLNLGTLDNVVYQNKLRVDSIDIENNTISTNVSNANLELRPNGTGAVNVHSDMNVDGNIYVTGNITADGNITIGDADTDAVVFNAEIASNVIPDQTDTYNLGSSEKRWADLWVRSIVTDDVNSGNLVIDGGIDISLRQGNIFYVAENGNDSYTGDHPQSPFKTIKHALSQAAVATGDNTTVYVLPGIYEEAFPLTIPTGVSLKGQGIRSVKVVPTIATQANDAFLLNGETTIEDLTIADFYSPGYAFKYAPGFTVTSRSPYIRNTTVITKGSVTTLEDPRGYNAGDAGKGAYLDGSVATSASKESSCLFHSVTFITPGVDAIELTNGVRVEWLNSFTYFANRSIYAYDGASGLKGLGQTAIRVEEVTGTFNSGETISYYDTDGTTLLASATIASIDDTGKIFLTGKQVNFETATERGGKTLVANGDAQLSTAVKKFGTASLALDGTGDYVSITANNDFGFGTGDFTVEGWLYLNNLSGNQIVFDFRAGVVGDVAPAVYVSNGGQIRYFTAGADRITGITLNSAIFYHISLVKESGNTKLYVNGTQVGSTYVDANDYGAAKPLNIGARYDGTVELDGFIDDVRVVKGVAITPTVGGPTTRVLVTPETVLMARFDGDNNSTTFADDVVYAQDIRFSGGATAKKITLTDFTDFGAEVRLIGSASVYGDFGLVGDGPGVIMYAIGQNLAYIGNGKEVTNDPATVIQENEIVEVNGARIRFNSVDHRGDFRIGDLFYVNQETGNVEFSVSNFNIDTENGVTFVTDGQTTFIDGTKIETGNWRISGNTLETLSGAANITAASGEVVVNSNLNINGSLDVTGNVTIGGNIQIGDEATDTIQIVAGIDSDIVPRQDSTYTLGTETKKWANLFVNEVNLDDIQIRDNFITTTISNANLELRANGTGLVIVPTNDVQINNDLTVLGTTTSLTDVSITGTISHTGDTTQVGNYLINGQLSNGNIVINENYIEATTTNSDLELRASGTGLVYIPNNNVQIDNNLFVLGTTTVGNTNIVGSVTVVGDTVQTGNYSLSQNLIIGQDLDVAGRAQFEEILINQNYITTTSSNTNLELRAAGTGNILIPSNNVEITNDLVVSQDIFADNITASATITANRFDTGDIIIDDNYITTSQSNSNLELRANGSGKIYIPENDLEIDNTVLVTGNTSLQNTELTGSLTQTGNTVQTGNIDLTGIMAVTGTATISSTAQFENIRINDNVIETTISDSNLEIRATQFGDVVIPTNDVIINNDLYVEGTIQVGNITSAGTITANRFSTGNILIDDNFITTTVSNSDLELRANGTGIVSIPSNNVVINQNFSILGDTSLKNTSITGQLTHVGNSNQTGNYTIDGNLTVTGTVNISETDIQFENIKISGNRITTTESNSNLELRANGTGKIIVPANNVLVENNLEVLGTVTVGNIISTGSVVTNSLSTGNILIDDNYITTTLSNSNLELRTSGTGEIIFKNFSVSDTTLSSSSEMILQPGNGILSVQSTGAMQIPVGNSSERPAGQLGQLRFNSELERFEGFNGTNWINLKGVESLNGDTRITPELFDGANDNIIRFYVSNVEVASIDSTKFSVPRLDVDDIRINGNVISTSTTNTNIVLDANGTGGVIIDNFEIKNSTIRNTVNNSNTIFENTNNGYVKFTGTYGIVLPSGTSGTRPPVDFVETGQVRFNTTDSRVEVWDGENWVSVAGSASGITRSEAENIAFEIALSLG